MAQVDRALVYRRGGRILRSGDFVAVKFVAVVGFCHDFAVYQGPTDWSDQEVKESGDKVSEEVGRAVAPYCAHLDYRL